jgi:hypothetical protein
MIKGNREAKPLLPTSEAHLDFDKRGFVYEETRHRRRIKHERLEKLRMIVVDPRERLCRNIVPQDLDRKAF